MTTATMERIYIERLGRSINRYCQNGHDLADERATRIYKYGTRTIWQCRECSSVRVKKFRRTLVPKAPIPCENCGTVFRPKTCTVYCSPSCRGKASAREVLARGRTYEGRPKVTEYLALCDERDRETRAWIRAELAAKVEEMRRRL